MFAAPPVNTSHCKPEMPKCSNFEMFKFETALRHRALAVGASVGAFLRAEPKSPIAETRLSTSQRMYTLEGKR